MLPKLIGFVGVSCSGKTTITLELTGRLKSEYNVLAECVTSQDRKGNFDYSNFAKHIEAHYALITKLISVQAEAMLRGDCTVVLCDRTPLDLLANAIVDHPDSNMLKGLTDFCLTWANRYDALYFLPRLPWQDDGKRCSLEIADKQDLALQELLEHLKLPNLYRIERQEITRHIRQLLNIEPVKELCFIKERYEQIARETGVHFYVKPSYSYDLSDVDVYIKMTKQVDAQKLQQVKQRFAEMFDSRRFVFDFIPIPELSVMDYDFY